jgi:hypothetical protein
MIVQFLNGTQFESDLPIEQLPMEIFRNQTELGLEIRFPVQIELLLRPEDTTLYAFIKSVDELEYGVVINSIGEFEDEDDRQRMLTRYFQYMACQSKFIFIKESTEYRIHSKSLGVDVNSISIESVGLPWVRFNNPEREVPPNMRFEREPPSGWKVVYHWVEANGELHAICTVVQYQDYLV